MYRTLIIFHWKTNFCIKVDFLKIEFFGGQEGIDLTDGGMGDLGSYTRVSVTFVFGKTKFFDPDAGFRIFRHVGFLTCPWVAGSRDLG